MQGFHVHIDAMNTSEVTPHAIMRKVKEVCGKKPEVGVPESVSEQIRQLLVLIKN